MRISDWSSDVCSSDLSIVRDTGAALVTVDPKRSLDLTARAGYLVTDNTLLYARGGYTNARVRTSFDGAAGFRSATENRDGWMVGGGVERAISDNVSARLESRSEEHTSELQSLMRISYAVFCL